MSHAFAYNHTSYRVPKTKGEIISALLMERKQVKESEQELNSWTVPELTHLLKCVKSARRHPCNPMVGISSHTRADLLSTCRRHGVEFEPGTRVIKAELLISLRKHWQNQVDLASAQEGSLPNDPSDSDQWSFLGQDSDCRTEQPPSSPARTSKSVAAPGPGSESNLAKAVYAISKIAAGALQMGGSEAEA